MRPDLHPPYATTKVLCACGNAWETRSTASSGELHLDICAACHPFFTGKQKLMDTQGRIDRFNKKYAANTAKVAADKAEKAAAPAPVVPEKKAAPAKEKKAKAPKAPKADA
jgi:large subunit ribosomal protein L31